MQHRKSMVPKDPIQYRVLTVTTSDKHTVVLGVCTSPEAAQQVFMDYFTESGLLSYIYNVEDDSELEDVLNTKSKADVIRDWFNHFDGDTYDIVPIRNTDQLIP